MFLFNHFSVITRAQMDVTGKLLGLWYAKNPVNDDARTHVLGGLTIEGHGVCADDCWCKGEEE